jgi:hypothetical protein
MTYAVRDHRAATVDEAKSLAEIVRNFTPNWFTVTMGTGALALTINQFPLEIPALHDGAVVLWLANIALFSLFSIAYAARWVFFFDGARRIFDHPVMSMFFGAIPMGRIAKAMQDNTDAIAAKLPETTKLLTAPPSKRSKGKPKLAAVS